jgi:glyoxylase-like metal-dependent hydrolase (beta-lactamase superfamily II)
MRIEQIYTGCLAQGAYYIESDGEAAIVDPLREVQPYIQKAAKDKASIKYVLETHFHADFVSGHLDLSRKTGAAIVYGPRANPSFLARIAEDGEELKLGRITIKVLHTPGHTPESSCYLILDETRKPTNKTHFDQWVKLFKETTDEHFEGPNAETAKQRGMSIATLIQIKIADLK